MEKARSIVKSWIKFEERMDEQILRIQDVTASRHSVKINLIKKQHLDEQGTYINYMQGRLIYLDSSDFLNISVNSTYGIFTFS